MTVPRRVPAEEVRRKLEANDNMTLVCAYDDEEKCRQIEIPGSISLAEFVRNFPESPGAREIVFY
jgi:hypothetical protein